MDRLAGNYLSNGDVANASSLYNSLEKLNPTKYNRMARICRVLSNPQNVPLPFRYDDICEALLDPTVPPEVLLRSSAEDVQKSFQRLAVCVHPDKNPNARAKDAFLRLTHMKDKALQLLRDKADVRDEESAPAAQRHNVKAAPAGVKRPQRPPLAGSNGSNAAAAKKRPAKHTTPPLTPLPELQAAASVSSGLDQLRQTTIKLNCLKRKDIADDFEIFSVTQRAVPGSAFDSPETSSAECGEEQLAFTVPVMPRGKKAPVGARRPPPLKRAEKQPPSVLQGLTSSLPRSPSSYPSLTSFTPPSGASPVVSLQPSPPPPSALPPIGETAEQHDTVAGAQGKMPAEGSRPLSATLTSDDAIRHEIDQTCLRLQEMRVHNTNIKLRLDLSFEAYQRGREGQ
ncbi:hypothetical protein ABB37_07077 [Leptomonas pyrrhocoris]|uniref:J domain-containing protein n=1 Tax=Leptomonas pyrrhocoris TaxID=157538 RepID=A0A0M9FW72_LEPPY|nr:hypothetical protein ABB37_07077 [Leptomonas pyrrhocoris]KPA77146.1 hypothetical protein ABB37_07077 [Leptomonas pyrrhocoris]|eukprot:XP_015655585.1 hypothetical protein ABB37_07077 [Leptomonas pyrrhocoris]